MQHNKQQPQRGSYATSGMWDWLSLKTYLLCPLLCCGSRHTFTQEQAAQWSPQLTRSAGCIVTVFKCEYEELSSSITSVRWKAPKASQQPAGQSQAEVFDKSDRYLTFSLALFSLLSPFSLPLSSHTCLVSLLHHKLSPTSPWGVVRELSFPVCCTMSVFVFHIFYSIYFQ